MDVFFSPHQHKRSETNPTSHVISARVIRGIIAARWRLLPSNLLKAPVFVSRSYTQGRPIKAGESEGGGWVIQYEWPKEARNTLQFPNEMEPWKVSVADKRDISDNLSLQHRGVTTGDIDVSTTTPPPPVGTSHQGGKCKYGFYHHFLHLCCTFTAV